jgi:hypothetical protein
MSEVMTTSTSFDRATVRIKFRIMAKSFCLRTGPALPFNAPVSPAKQMGLTIQPHVSSFPVNFQLKHWCAGLGAPFGFTREVYDS